MNICVFGDSIVWGACDYECGGWVERLKSYLMQNKEDIDVYNLGISGNNSQDLLKRFEAEALVRKVEEAKAIVFGVGINDSQYVNTQDNPCVSLDEFEENISKLIEKARKVSKNIMFVGLTRVDEAKVMPIPWDRTKYYENEIIRKYDQAISDVCKKNGIPFVSVIEVLNIGDLEDGLHPNSSGHAKMFEKIRPEVEKLLANLKQ